MGADEESVWARGDRGVEEELAALLRTDAAAVPAGRRVEMLLHRQLDGDARRLLVERLGARFDGAVTGAPDGSPLGEDVRVVVTERRPFCWLVSAQWPEGVVPATSASRVRAAFRSVLTALGG